MVSLVEEITTYAKNENCKSVILTGDMNFECTNFLASAVGAKANLSESFGLEHQHGTYNDALEFWLDSA